MVDLYCLYNRARGTNLVSPEDINDACLHMSRVSSKYTLKAYPNSGIRTIQLKSFNETAYFEKLEKALSEQPGLTVDRLAKLFKVNPLVMKEQI